MDQVRAILEMIQNEDFPTMSQIAVVNNEDVDNIDEEDEIVNEVDDDLDEDEILDNDAASCNLQVPSTFMNLEETNLMVDENWMASNSENKKDFMLELGKDFFNDKEDVIRAIKLYSIKTHKHFEVVESRPTIWSIRCKLHKQGCNWKLRASKRKRSGSFEISKYIGPHTCLHYNITQDHPNLDASLISQEIQHLIKEQPSISIIALRAEVTDKLGYTASYKKVWVGKQKAIEKVFGDWDESYIILPRFLGALQRFNPGSIVEWCVLRQSGVDQMEFRRVFWAFDPSIRGFKHCRPVISIDATHLYGKYKGKMMIAMGVDGNNQILPLAFAIVEKALAYRAGSQNQIRKFDSIMEEIGKINPQARQWLEGHPRDKWTLAHDDGKRYGLLTTNLSEIFNSVLKGARFLPITACVQLTFYRMVHYFDVRRALGPSAQANGDAYTPHVAAKQGALMSKAGAHSLRSFNRQKGIFEVTTQKGKNVQVVKLEEKSCTCGKWKIFKYLCSHVLSACAGLSLNPWQFVDKCYSIANYCATWSSEFSPLPHEAYWPQSSLIRELLPNSDLRREKRGRPRSTRLRNGMDIKEGKKSNRYGICREVGHSRVKCPSKLRRMDV